MRFRDTVGYGLGAVILVWLIGYGSLFQRLELQTLDYRFRRKPVPERAKRIVIVGIDDDTLESWKQRSPLPRRHLASLIHVLDRAGARIILLDVLLDQATDSTSDHALARVIRESGKVVLVQVEGTPPRKEFVDRALGAGFVDLAEDPDKVIRRMSLAIGGSRCAPLVVAEKLTERQVVSGDELRQGLVINYSASPRQGFDYVSAGKAGSDQSLPSVVNGRIVLVGSYASDAQDRIITPLSQPERMAGVEVLAHTINTLLGVRLRSMTTFAVASCVLLLSITSYLIISRLSIAWGTAAAVLLSVSIHTAVEAAFQLGHLVVPLIVPVAVVWANLGMVHGARTFRELKERREQTRSLELLFRRYLSPQVVEEILRDPDRVQLGGARRRVTVLFADLRGFTSQSEHSSPEEVVQILNSFLSRMVHVALSEGGMVDKFIGDAVMVVFGAPLERSGDTFRAVRCAVSMKQETEEMKTEWRAKGLQPFDMTIGLNTGEVVAGNVGDIARMEYTVIGDVVNVAQRVQEAAKQLGGAIVMSETTYAEVEDHVDARPLGEETLRGREQPVRLFALIGIRDPTGRIAGTRGQAKTN